MPVRSLNSFILKWPDAQTVAQAVRHWSQKALLSHFDVIRIGYFGSYARGDWGVGSDLDLIIVVESSDQPFERRASKWDATELPVPADVLVGNEDVELCGPASSRESRKSSTSSFPARSLGARHCEAPPRVARDRTSF